MAKHIVKENGKMVDRNNGNAEFKGRVVRDMEIGDVFERKLPNGKKELTEITDRKIERRGFIVVTMKKWEVDDA